MVDVRTKRQREIEPRTGGLFPDWSPDGALIAFTGLRGRTGDSVHLMTPRGKHVRDLGSSGAGECAEWSPDGRRIAYCGHDGDGNWAIWVMNRDGSNKRQLTHPVPSSPPGSGGDYPGAWSPDGRQIVYSGGQGDFDLFLMNSDGTDRRRLTDWPGGDGASAWLPSGQIVFSHFTGDQRLPRWYLLNPDGSGLRSLPWLYGAGDPLDWIQLRTTAAMANAPPSRSNRLASVISCLLDDSDDYLEASPLDSSVGHAIGGRTTHCSLLRRTAPARIPALGSVPGATQ